jgi:hypothetical protein
MMHYTRSKSKLTIACTDQPAKDMFQDYVVRFSKKSVIFAILQEGGKLGTPTHLSNFVPHTVAWYGYTCNNVASIPMPYKKDKL